MPLEEVLNFGDIDISSAEAEENDLNDPKLKAKAKEFFNSGR
jgi:hypothetical protein